MKNTITITGSITKKGEHGFYNIDAFKDFCKNHKGYNTTVTFTAEKPNSIKGLLAYYHARVLNEWQYWFYTQGEIKTVAEVDMYLRDDCPLLKQKSLSDLSYDELIMFLEYVKHKSLEEINVFIECPKCL